MTADCRTSILSGAAVYGVVMTTSQTSVSSDWQDPATIDRMLDEAQTWAVVGLSGDPGRTAYTIAALLQERGKRIVPVHPVFADPGAPAVLGEQGYATLADVPVPIDVVDVFRRSEAAAGVPMVMDTCPAIEWRKRGR